MGVSRIRETSRSFFIKQMKSFLPSHPHTETPPPQPHPHRLIGGSVSKGGKSLVTSGWFDSWAPVSDSPHRYPDSLVLRHIVCFCFFGFLAWVPHQDHGNQENGSYQIETTLVLGLLCKFLQHRLRACDLRGTVHIWPCPRHPQTSHSVAGL